ncbi:hypothetical protein Tco_0594296 [Tanacetum coccineum]
MDHREGKRVISVPIDDEINKVFGNLMSGAINKNLKFAIGSNSMTSNDLKSDVSYDITNGNDGLVHTSMDVGGNTSCEQTSSRDDITFAKTGIVEGRAGSGPSIEHTSMKVVVSTGVGLSSGLDGIACYKDGGNFEFWGNDKSKGILKKPVGLFFKVHFGVNSISHPFGLNNVSPKGNAWNTSGIKGFRSTMLSNYVTFLNFRSFYDSYY